jgi:hypothetical protein
MFYSLNLAHVTGLCSVDNSSMREKTDYLTGNWGDPCRVLRHRGCTVKKTPCISLRFEVFTAATMKNAVFWDINPQFFTGNTLRLHYTVQSVNAV